MTDLGNKFILKKIIYQHYPEKMLVKLTNYENNSIDFKKFQQRPINTKWQKPQKRRAEA